MKKRFGAGTVCVFLILMLVVPTGTALAQEMVKLNGFEIDVKGQEPAVPQNLEPGDDAQDKIKSIPTGSIIQLHKGKNKFERGQMPAVPRHIKQQDDEKYKKWIVQFTGPIHEEQKKSLIDIGCRVGDYLPEFAFIVTMNNKIKTQVEQLPFIRGIVRYKPAYKIDRKLKDEFGAVRVEAGKKIKLHIRVDGAENRSLVLSEVYKKKGKVLNVSGDLVKVEAEQAHIAQLSQIEEVLWIEEAVDLKLLNDTSKWTIQTYIPNDTKIWDKGLHGEGQVVGIGDTGLDYDMPWFRDPAGAPIGPTHRKVVGYTPYMDDYDGNMGHGTHVSGTVGGDRTPVDGLSSANGMAPKAKIFMQDITPGEEPYVYPPSDLGEMFIIPYSAGARLHTNSWGSSVNAYEGMARSADLFMWEHKDFLAIFANGNAGPAVGTVGTPANAKNIVSVGATENGTDAENVAFFSSNGPAADGRIKPTVTAPGVAIVSADSDGIKNSFNNGTIAYSGTSMAAPTAAGAAALVRQYYENGFWPSGTANAADSFAPSAAIIKATLINSAQNMTGTDTDAPIPSTGQGWGRINLSNILHFAEDANSLDVADVSSGLQTGVSWSKHYNAIGDQPVKVTLVWTDYPGSTGATKALVNDLDLTVTAPDGVSTYFGNVFAGGSSITGGSADRLNVEEQVLILSAQQGSYTVTVTAYNVPYGPQPFAVVVSGAGGITPKGFITLDRTRYNGTSTIQIKVGDQDLSQNSATIEETSVTVTSSTEPGGEVVRLVETGPNTALFVGTLSTRLGAAIASNGTLEVAEGDLITAPYQDANDGTGTPATVTATAVADLTPPVVSALSADSIGQETATITWTTSEPATATINYGETSALGASQSVPWLMTSHTAVIGNLKEATVYYYEVASTDEAGNVVRDNNSGTLYTFTTVSSPPNLTVYSSNFSETYQPETVIFGNATDPSGVASVVINGQPAAYRASDGYYELSVSLTYGENVITVAAADSLGNVRTLTMVVTRYELPDLVMTTMAGPARAGIGEPFPTDNSVCNIGRGPAMDFIISWYLSTDTAITPEDTAFAVAEYADVLLPGECFSFNWDLTISTTYFYSMVGSTFYLGSYADSWGWIWESDETNNGLAGNQITIDGPDLAVISVSAPVSVLTGTGFTVESTLVNSGMGASPAFDVRFYLSQDAVITQSDILTGYASLAGLGAGKTATVSRPVSIPSSVPGGTYYIGAVAVPINGIEANESNNVGLGNQVTVVSPDIFMTSVSGPISAPSGSSITIPNTVTASASGGAASGFRVGLYLSTDNVITKSDIGLGSRTVDSLAPGASSSADTTVTIPAAIGGGTYYIGAIADADNGVSESDETNNVLVGNVITVTGPDLMMTAVSGPASGSPGATITVNNTVTASASGSASPEFYVGIFLSNDPVITGSDTLIGYRYVPGLAPGASSSDATVVALPNNIAGTYYIGAIADNFPLWLFDEGSYTDYLVYDNVKESDETNNTVAGNQIALGGPDLSMTTVSGPETARKGRQITVTNTATNTGALSSSLFYVRIYLSTDSVITGSDWYMGSRSVTSLASGATDTANTTVTVPDVIGFDEEGYEIYLPPGTYYIGAIADGSDMVAELNETNNALTGNQVVVR